jgi:hypothetical protein
VPADLQTCHTAKIAGYIAADTFGRILPGRNGSA